MLGRSLVIAAALLGALTVAQAQYPLPFPEPPSGVTHLAVTEGLWNQPSTWSSGTVPGNGAVVRIPNGIKVTITNQVTSDIKFITVEGELRMSIWLDTLLTVETLYVAPSGFFAIGAPGNPVMSDKKAEVVFKCPATPIDLTWDPEQKSRGLFAKGKVHVYGFPKTYLAEMTNDAHENDSTLDLGSPVPADWTYLDELVLTGTQFKRNAPLEDEPITIGSTAGNVITLQGQLLFDHLRADAGKKLHVVNLTRNVVFRSDATATAQRGHVIFHHQDVELHHARFTDLGRTDKRIPLDEIKVDPVNGDVYPRTPSQIMNRRARYPIHFHQIGMQPGVTPPSRVHDCVVTGVIGWGLVNHSSHVDFQRNVCYDFAGAAFVTEHGNELGNFHDNIAIHGTGVPGEYFFVRQVFENDDRPQPLGDFGFGGDGFWFQGPAISVKNNVANSCNGSGMFWFTAGAVDIADNRYTGFDPSAIPIVYAGYPDIGSLTWRTWYDSNLAVIADLPILEMDGFQGYACLVGFRLRFNNHDVVALYNEDPYDYDVYLQGSATRIRQKVQNITVWNNEQGFRVRYNEKTDWSNVDNVNHTRFDKPNVGYVGAEFFHEANDQIFTNLGIRGYAVAGWLISSFRDNSAEVTFNNAVYDDYANADTSLDPDSNSPRDPVTLVNVTNITSSSAMINWTPPTTQPDRYLIRYSVQGSDFWEYSTETNGGASSHPLTGLSSQTTYDVQVIVGYPTGVSNWSSTIGFTTN